MVTMNLSTFTKCLAPPHLHTCAENERIKDIDRSIWKIKERVRCGFHSIPYKKFTILMMISLVEDMITCLNMFPSKNWISSNLTPAAIILRSPNIYYNKLNILFGAYAQVYIGTNKSTKHRIFPCNIPNRRIKPHPKLH